MRIDPSFQYLGNNASENVGNAQGQQKVPSPGAGAGNEIDSNSTDAGDTVELSGTLSAVQQLKAQLVQTPDLRANRVAALQQQLQQGTYKPSDAQIASAMVSELFGTGSQS